MDAGYIIIILLFLVYYFSILIFERKIIQEPREIIDKFLSFALIYAGIAIIYYSLTGRPFLTDSEESYRIYIFIIGFIALLWAIPNVLQEFSFFKKFVKKSKKKH